MSLFVKQSIGNGHFAGSGKVFSRDSDGLAEILRGLQQYLAQTEVAAASLTALVNTGGGGLTAAGDAANDEVDATAHGLSDGDSVAFGGTTPPAGLVANQVYYVVGLTAATGGPISDPVNSFQVALTPGGAPIDITDAGTAALVFRPKAFVLPVQTDISGGTTGTTAASVETSKDSVTAAYRELAERANAVFALFTGGDIGVGSSSTAADGTIDAIDVDTAANTTDDNSSNFADIRSMFDTLHQTQQGVEDAVNAARRAVALGELSILSTVGLSGSPPQGVLPTSIVTVTNVTGGVTSVTEAAVEAALVVLQENVALLASGLNEVSEVSAPTTVPSNAGGSNR